MATFITIKDYCDHYHLRTDFLQALVEAGLVDFEGSDNRGLMSDEQFDVVECCRRLHYDLDINIEGVVSITHLLQRQRKLQQEIELLRSRLRLYE